MLILMVSFPQPRIFLKIWVIVLPIKISGWDSLRHWLTFFNPMAGSTMMGRMPSLRRASAKAKKSTEGGVIKAARMFEVSEQAESAEAKRLAESNN